MRDALYAMWIIVNVVWLLGIVESLISTQWASYQIRKIAGRACAGNAGNVFPRRRFQRKPLVSDPGMHHGTCVTHVPWCMSGSLTCGDGENVPGIPGACAPANLRIWQEAHWCCECDTRLASHWEWNNAVVKVNPWTSFAGDDIGMIKQMLLISWFLANCLQLDLTNFLITCLLTSSLSGFVLCSCHSVVAFDGQVTRNWSNVAVNCDLLNASRSARALMVPGFLNIP